MSIAVVSIPVADQSAALTFYTGTMDFAVLVDAEMSPTMRWLQLQPKTGGSSIALVDWFADTMPPGSSQGLLLHVPDVDAEHARLAGLGVTLTPIEAQPWGRFTMLQDPDGNGWVVAQLTAPEQMATT